MLLPFVSTGTAVPLLALLSGAFQILGHARYLRHVGRGEVTPNAATWVMYAYGSAAIALLELGAGATRQELVLPAICALVSTAIAMGAARQSFGRLQLDQLDRTVFAVDLLLTTSYVLLLGGHELHLVSTNTLNRMDIVVLTALNLTDVTSSIPIVRTTLRDPATERPGPWLAWGISYALLFLLTALQSSVSILLLFPAMSGGVCVVIGALSVRRQRRDMPPFAYERAETPRRPSSSAALYVAPTSTTGLGVYTRIPFRPHEAVLGILGEERIFKSRTIADALSNPDWIGVGKHRWLEPTGFAAFLNHSCEPNLGFAHERLLVAIRDIESGEQLTFDYAVSEDEPLWTMHCACGAANCRGVIRSVHHLPEEIWNTRLPFVLPHFRRVRERAWWRPKLYRRTRSQLAEDRERESCVHKDGDALIQKKTDAQTSV